MVGKIRQAKLSLGSSIFLLVVCIALFAVFALADTYDARMVNGDTVFYVANTSLHFFNLTINNTQNTVDGNITWVNITLPSVLSYYMQTANISLPGNYTFVNSSDVLSWRNTTGYLINATANVSFWFNASIVSGTTDGNYTIMIKAVHNTSNVFNLTNITIVYDTTIPVVSLSTPTATQYLNSRNFSVNFTLTETNRNYTNITIYNFTDLTVANSTQGTGADLNTTFQVQSDGNFTANVTSYDLAGNSNKSGVYFIVDTVAPVVRNGSSSNASGWDDNGTRMVGRNRISLKVNVTETHPSTINYTLFSVNASGYSATYNSTVLTLSTFPYTANGTNITWSSLPDGNYTVNVTVTDLAGNTGTTKVIESILVNNTVSPVIGMVNGDTVFYVANTSLHFFNLTINNTQETVDGNITWINITLPSVLSYYRQSANVSLSGNYTFVNSSSVLSWRNTTDYLINATANVSFWFNASIVSGTTDGNYTIMTRAVYNTFNVFNLTNITIVYDTTAPVVTIASPTVIQYLNARNASVNFTLTETNRNYTNVTIYNSTTAANSSASTAKDSNVTLQVQNDGNFTANVTSYDLAGNSGKAGVFFVVDTVVPSVRNGTALNASGWDGNDTGISNRSRIYLKVNVTEVYPSTVNFTLFSVNSTSDHASYNSTVLTMTNLLTVNNTNITWSNLPNGNYTVNVTITDLAGNVNTSKIINRLEIRDVTAPVITLVSPVNNVDSTTSAYNFTFNVSESNDIKNCTWVLDGVAVMSVTALNRLSNDTTNGIYNGTLTAATHTWNVNCTDSAGNVGASSTYYLTVSAAAAASSTSTGGSSAATNTTTTTTVSYWAVTYSHNDAELSSKGSVNRALGVKERVSIKVNGSLHDVGVVNVASDKVTVNVSSTPQQAILAIGESAKFELTGDNYYDLLVTLNSIQGVKANLSMVYVHEAMPAGAGAGNSSTGAGTVAGATDAGATGVGDEEEQASSGARKWVLIIVIVLVIAALVIFLMKYNRTFSGVEKKVKVKHP